MDGNFISTDIRYRDNLKCRRRSTSCAKTKSPGGGGARSKSADVGVGGGGNSTVVEEVGAEEGAGGDGGISVVDDVFEEPITLNNEDNMGNISVGGANVEVQIDVGGAGGDETVNVSAEAKVEGPGDNSVIGGGRGVAWEVVDSVEVEGGEIGDGGVEGLVGEKPKGGDDDGSIGGIYGMEEVGGVGEEGGEGGATASGSVEGSVVEPVHHIPVWRLREILAHAEGKCMLLV